MFSQIKAETGQFKISEKYGTQLVEQQVSDTAIRSPENMLSAGKISSHQGQQSMISEGRLVGIW